MTQPTWYINLLSTCNPFKKTFAASIAHSSVRITPNITFIPIEKGKFDVWSMSPPCQPYTKQKSSKQLQENDQRNSALAHIIVLIRSLPQRLLPKVIVLENVRHFARSKSCIDLLAALYMHNYKCHAFLLSPRQFGFPNERSRFFLCCIKQEDNDSSATQMTEEAAYEKAKSLRIVTDVKELAYSKGLSFKNMPFQDFIYPQAHKMEGLVLRDETLKKRHTYSMDLVFFDDAVEHANLDAPTVINPSNYQDKSDDEEALSHGSPELSECSLKRSRAADGAASTAKVVLGRTDRRKGYTMCFTKGYGRLFDGTGSCLVVEGKYDSDEEEKEGASAEEPLARFYGGRVRFFHPREIALMMGYKFPGSRNSHCNTGPESHSCLPIPAGGPDGKDNPSCLCGVRVLSLPPVESDEVVFSKGRGSLGMRSYWALLGNSLNPQVVGVILVECGVVPSLFASF